MGRFSRGARPRVRAAQQRAAEQRLADGPREPEHPGKFLVRDLLLRRARARAATALLRRGSRLPGTCRRGERKCINGTLLE